MAKWNPNPNREHQFKPWHTGRPKWTRNAETLFRDAIKALAIKLEKSPDDIEIELVHTVFTLAKKGNLKAMEMYLDRLYGKPKQEILNKVVDAPSELELWE